MGPDHERLASLDALKFDWDSGYGHVNVLYDDNSSLYQHCVRNCSYRATQVPKWSEEEDSELRKHVRLRGARNWKDALDNSSILQEHFAAASGTFHCCLHCEHGT